MRINLKNAAARNVFFLACFLSLFFISEAKADYCNVDLSPAFVFLNDTASLAGNLTKVNSTTYVYSVNSTQIYFSLNCAGSNSFFVIPQNYQENILLAPNQSYNVSFYITPVVLGKNFAVHGRGLNEFTSSIANLSQPYLFNTTLYSNFSLPVGNYSQIYEITNGLEVKYLFVKVNVPYSLVPAILKVDVPDNVTYGKLFQVGVLTNGNVNNIELKLIRDNETIHNYTMVNSTPTYFSTTLAADYIANAVLINATNSYFSTSMKIPITFKKIQYTLSDMSYPALEINKNVVVKLVDFGIDTSVIVSASVSKLTNNSFDIMLTDENNVGISSSAKVKQLNLVVSPHDYSLGSVQVTLYGDTIDPTTSTARIEWIGSSFTNTPILNLDYMGKPTICSIIGTSLNSSYECKFYVPSTYNMNRLESDELSLMNQSCSLQHSSDVSKYDSLHLRYTISMVVLIIAAVGAVLYILWKRGFLLAIGGGKK